MDPSYPRRRNGERAVGRGATTTALISNFLIPLSATSDTLPPTAAARADPKSPQEEEEEAIAQDDSKERERTPSIVFLAKFLCLLWEEGVFNGGAAAAKEEIPFCAPLSALL